MQVAENRTKGTIVDSDNMLEMSDLINQRKRLVEQRDGLEGPLKEEQDQKIEDVDDQIRAVKDRDNKETKKDVAPTEKEATDSLAAEEGSINIENPAAPISFEYDSEEDIPESLKLIEPKGKGFIEIDGKKKVRLTYSGQQLIDAGIGVQSETVTTKKEDKKTTNKFAAITKELKNITGIYYLYNEIGEIIYIGKSKSIKNRVNQHLTGNSNKSLKIQLEINSVSFESCGNELIALLKESDEIKVHKPKFNKLLKKEIVKFGLELCIDTKKMKFLRIIHYQQNCNYIETYSSLKNANKRLISIKEKYDIKDPKTLINNIKIENFIKEVSFPYSNMIIIDKGRNVDEKSVILIKESKYVGFGYFNLNYQITNYNILESLISKTNSCQSYDKLIISYIKKIKVEKIINTENLK